MPSIGSASRVIGICLLALAIVVPCADAQEPAEIPAPATPIEPPEVAPLPAQDPIAPSRPEGGPLLGRPIERPDPESDTSPSLGRVLFGLPFRTPTDPMPGYAGRSSIRPTETQEDPHFVPVEDRWRVGFPL